MFHRVDQCHQANDEDDDDDENCYNESFLEKTEAESGKTHRNINGHRRYCSFPMLHVGRRQKIVTMVK